MRHAVIASLAIDPNRADKGRVRLVANMEGVSLYRFDRVHLVVQLARIERVRPDRGGNQRDRNKAGPAKHADSATQAEPTSSSICEGGPRRFWSIGCSGCAPNNAAVGR